MTPTATSITMYETSGAGFSRVDFQMTGVLTSVDQYTAQPPSPRANEWRQVVTARLAELERLAPGWDSDGGRPVGRQHADRASVFVARLMALGELPLPDIVPLADGGVQLEWHTSQGGRIDFVTDEEAAPVVLLQDGEHLTETPAHSVDLAQLRALLEG